jgi:geranylgeranyl diphosphate synthase type I
MTLSMRHSHGTEDIAEILAHSRRLMDPALQNAVARLHPGPGRMAAFSFGWVESDGTPRGAANGKGVRPALALLSARAAGAPAETAVPGAVAVELVHAFSLVHDDIMDGDERRRHRETVWKAYWIGPAVLGGDALLALAVDTLARAGGAQTGAAMLHLSAALVELVHGQAEDADFESRPWIGPDAVTVEQYCAMAVGKTGSLLGSAAAVGALLGGGPPDLADRMSRLGRHLGLAFQAVDDLLGIWGDPEVTGKPVFSDLRRGKKTLPIVAATWAAPGLSELLAARSDDEAALRRLAGLVEDAGGRGFTDELAARELERALDIINTSGLDGAAARDLAALSRFLVHRAS